jgi:hypothetical protein
MGLIHDPVSPSHNETRIAYLSRDKVRRFDSSGGRFVRREKEEPNFVTETDKHFGTEFAKF